MKRNIKNLFFTFSAASLLILGACNNAGTEGKDPKDVAEEQNDDKFSKPAEKDAQFAVDAAAIGLKEIKFGELASTRAMMAETKELATMMVQDHTTAANELQALAAAKGISLPSALSDEAQRDYNRLSEKSGADFDKEYADMMVKGHKDAIDKFEKAADDCDDAELKAFAAKTLPTLRMHLENAEHCQEMSKDMKREM